MLNNFNKEPLWRNLYDWIAAFAGMTINKNPVMPGTGLLSASTSFDPASNQLMGAYGAL